MNRRGFTMVEIMISLVILAFAIVGLSSTTARLARVAVEAESKALALQAVEDRIARVRMHPVYQELDSLFTENSSQIVGLPDYTRSTSLSRIIEPGDREGKYVDYTRITVTVKGPGLHEPVSRTVAIGVS